MAVGGGRDEVEGVRTHLCNFGVQSMHSIGMDPNHGKTDEPIVFLTGDVILASMTYLHTYSTESGSREST